MMIELLERLRERDKRERERDERDLSCWCYIEGWGMQMLTRTREMVSKGFA
jgi:hypothetical protein